MRKICIVVLISLSLFAFGCGRGAPTGTGTARTHGEATGEWIEDFEQARKTAAAVNRPVLANFTGSDWCGWCIRLKKEIFDTEEFAQYARDHVVLFVADFPARIEQTEELKTQNRTLAETYGVAGFPAVLLLDAEGRLVAQTGYRPGGADAYIKHLKELLDEAAADASKETE